jgi:hypothetical protein
MYVLLIIFPCNTGPRPFLHCPCYFQRRSHLQRGKQLNVGETATVQLAPAATLSNYPIGSPVTPHVLNDEALSKRLSASSRSPDSWLKIGVSHQKLQDQGLIFNHNGSLVKQTVTVLVAARSSTKIATCTKVLHLHMTYHLEVTF